MLMLNVCILNQHKAITHCEAFVVYKFIFFLHKCKHVCAKIVYIVFVAKYEALSSILVPVPDRRNDCHSYEFGLWLVGRPLRAAVTLYAGPKDHLLYTGS